MTSLRDSIAKEGGIDPRFQVGDSLTLTLSNGPTLRVSQTEDINSRTYDDQSAPQQDNQNRDPCCTETEKRQDKEMGGREHSAGSSGISISSLGALP